NVQINHVLVPVVQELIVASPAFAAQCARIAEARYVRVIINPVLSSSTTSRGTARTAMRRYTSGALIAVVDMPVPLTFMEYAELFGHELEHILEQIDRVDLAALSDAGDGASRLSDGAYETARARRAGLLIADEIARPRAVLVSASSPASSLTPTRTGTKATAPSIERGPALLADAPAAPPPAAPNIGGAAAAIRQF
ncbi:MAG: hypothetical protein ABIX28_17545, partial [Vicinamibacterales bacterium]